MSDHEQWLARRTAILMDVEKRRYVIELTWDELAYLQAILGAAEDIVTNTVEPELAPFAWSVGAKIERMNARARGEAHGWTHDGHSHEPGDEWHEHPLRTEDNAAENGGPETSVRSGLPPRPIR